MWCRAAEDTHLYPLRSQASIGQDYFPWEHCPVPHPHACFFGSGQWRASSSHNCAVIGAFLSLAPGPSSSSCTSTHPLVLTSAPAPLLHRSLLPG